jgi:hypothetical protein
MPLPPQEFAWSPEYTVSIMAENQTCVDGGGI